MTTLFHPMSEDKTCDKRAAAKFIDMAWNLKWFCDNHDNCHDCCFHYLDRFEKLRCRLRNQPESWDIPRQK